MASAGAAGASAGAEEEARPLLAMGLMGREVIQSLSRLVNATRMGAVQFEINEGEVRVLLFTAKICDAVCNTGGGNHGLADRLRIVIFNASTGRASGRGRAISAAGSDLLCYGEFASVGLLIEVLTLPAAMQALAAEMNATGAEGLLIEASEARAGIFLLDSRPRADDDSCPAAVAAARLVPA